MKKSFTSFCTHLAALTAVIVLAMNCMQSNDEWIRSKVVKLTGNHHACSGVQFRAPSGTDYILTAGHCAGLAQNGSMETTTEDGRTMLRRVVAEDPLSDLLLLEGLPGVKGIEMAEVSRPQDHVRTYTHGHAMPTYRTDGVLIGEGVLDILAFPIDSPEALARCESQPKYRVIDSFFGSVCVLHLSEMATTAMIVPGSSGGLVISDKNYIAGIVSAGGDGFGYLVTITDIFRFTHNY